MSGSNQSISSVSQEYMPAMDKPRGNIWCHLLVAVLWLAPFSLPDVGRYSDSTPDSRKRCFLSTSDYSTMVVIANVFVRRRQQSRQRYMNRL